MLPRIHFVTVVGASIRMLPHLLSHYRGLGVESILVNVHMQSMNDSVLDAAKRVTDAFGCGIASTTIGDWQSNLRTMYAKQRQCLPNDWFILADQDELQLYPEGVLDAVEYCQRKGHDYVRGVMIDRTSADGRLQDLHDDTDLASQFPLGGFISLPLLGADPRKVVAAKGRIPLAKGQHCALAGAGCPVKDLLIQVHHFKWVQGLEEQLAQRIANLKTRGVPHWVESERFLSYYNAHGQRIAIEDPRFHIARCDPNYKKWDVICRLAEHYSRSMQW